MTVLGLFVGTLIDRFDVRRVAIVCESVSLVIAAALAALTLGGDHRRGRDLRAGRASRGSSTRSTGRRATRSSSRWSGPRDLPNAVALTSSLGTSARILGPAIGGAVVAVVGAGVASRSTRRASSGSSSCLLALDTSKLLRPARDHAATIVGGAADSLRFVRSSRRGGVAFVAVFVLSTFAFNFNVLLPLVADKTLHRAPGPSA